MREGRVAIRCDECGKYLKNSDHSFAGYGFFVAYCPEHCPRHVDGIDCDYDHPETEKELEDADA